MLFKSDCSAVIHRAKQVKACFCPQIKNSAFFSLLDGPFQVQIYDENHPKSGFSLFSPQKVHCPGWERFRVFQRQAKYYFPPLKFGLLRAVVTRASFWSVCTSWYLQRFPGTAFWSSTDRTWYLLTSGEDWNVVASSSLIHLAWSFLWKSWFLIFYCSCYFDTFER